MRYRRRPGVPGQPVRVRMPAPLQGCFNKETWDFDYGMPYTKDNLKMRSSVFLRLPIFRALRFLAGSRLSRRTRRNWQGCLKECGKLILTRIYGATLYLYDVDLPGGRVHTEVTEEMLSYIDVLVDGEFIEEEKDVTLVFRGSRNQRGS